MSMQQEDSIEQQAAQLSIGTLITITLVNGKEITGTLIGRGENQLALRLKNQETRPIRLPLIGMIVPHPNPEPTESSNGSTASTGHLLSNQVQSLLVPSTELVHIKTLFDAHVPLAKLQFQSSDFTIDVNVLPSKERKSARAAWQLVKNNCSHIIDCYDMANQSRKIIADIKEFMQRYPTLHILKRHLANILFLSGEVTEALNCCKYAAVDIDTAHDWQNLAVLALKTDNPALACYALDHLFDLEEIEITDSQYIDGWYVYISLLQKIDNYALLHYFIEYGQKQLSLKEKQLLWGTCLYLLLVKGNQEAAQILLASQMQQQELLTTLEDPAFWMFKESFPDTYNLVQIEMRALPPFEVQLFEALLSQSDTFESEHIVPEEHIELLPNSAFKNGRVMPGEIVVYSTIADQSQLTEAKTLVTETSKKSFSSSTVALDIPYSAIDKMFKRAEELADQEKYPNAIAEVKRLLALDPAYPGAQQAYETWRERARVAQIPRGSEPYAQARRALYLNKDLDRVVDLFYVAIYQNDRRASAVKDLASLFLRLNRGQEAIQLLLQYRDQIKITDQSTVENLLIQAYQKTREYAKTIELLKKKLAGVPQTKENIAKYGWQIAYAYFALEEFVDARKWFQKVLGQGIAARKIAAHIQIAICYFKEHNYEQAERLLNLVLSLDPPPDVQEQVTNLLVQMRLSQETGQSSQVDFIVNEIARTGNSIGISPFTRFFMEHCNYEGIDPVRLQEGLLDRTDIERLEKLVAEVGPRRPKARADYYLSAATIVSKLEDLEDPNQLLYCYLWRSFTSRGDDLVLSGGQLDSIREWYCEALRIYNGDRSRGKDDPDVICATIRFLYSLISIKLIPMQDYGTIEDALQEVFDLHLDQEKAFDAITYLISSSRYAENRILNRLHRSSHLRNAALAYLTSKGLPDLGPDLIPEEFSALWKEHIKRTLDEMRRQLAELRSIAKIEITPASLERSIHLLQGLNFFLELDRRRVDHLQIMLETARDACIRRSFEERERLCLRFDQLCKDLLEEITGSPTKISVEILYPMVESLQMKMKEYLQEVYSIASPRLNIRLAFDSYTPDDDHCIDVQIVAANGRGCSPAEVFELLIVEELLSQSEFLPFTIDPTSETAMRELIRGGEQHIFNLRLQLTEHGLQQQAFSLPICVLYQARSAESSSSETANLPLSLSKAEQFTEIFNPYATYARGGVVMDERMFFGREPVIERVTRVICETREERKSLVIYGQKRSGKSSILHHLNKRFQGEKDLLVLNIGDIGALLEQATTQSLLIRIFWSILSSLQSAIKDEEARGRSSLGLSFPRDVEFYNHPYPVGCFRDCFQEFKRAIACISEWKDVRVVVLIDEFSYIYGKIMTGDITEDFMKIWKAIQDGYFFSLVLVGQDTMPKFIQKYPNGFGTIEEIRLNYLDDIDARALIDNPIRINGGEGDSRYREKAVESIIDLTAGSPFYIQIVCNRLVLYMNTKRTPLVTEADVDQVKQKFIQGAQALDENDFDNLLASGDNAPDAISSTDAKSVLKSIAVNSRRGPCKRDAITCQTLQPIDIILEDLVRRQVIEQKDEQYYRIKVGLFKEWLLAH